MIFSDDSTTNTCITVLYLEAKMTTHIPNRCLSVVYTRWIQRYPTTLTAIAEKNKKYNEIIIWKYEIS